MQAGGDVICRNICTGRAEMDLAIFSFPVGDLTESGSLVLRSVFLGFPLTTSLFPRVLARRSIRDALGQVSQLAQAVILVHPVDG